MAFTRGLPAAPLPICGGHVSRQALPLRAPRAAEHRGPHAVARRPGRAPLVTCHAGAYGEDDDNGGNEKAYLKASAQKLEALFRMPPSESADGAEAAGESSAERSRRRAVMEARSDLLEDLPLWRVQWALLPGCTEELHVHVPHYVDMFNRILAQPRPWRFGHIYLPGGSANLGAEEYRLEADSSAPLVGCVMEVEAWRELDDGRLLLQCHAHGRMRVVQQTTQVPFSRATVQWYPDYEEVAVFEQAASDAATAAVAAIEYAQPSAATQPLPGDLADRTAPVLARVSAVKFAQVWAQYEAPAKAKDCESVYHGDSATARALNDDQWMSAVRFGASEVIHVGHDCERPPSAIGATASRSALHAAQSSARVLVQGLRDGTALFQGQADLADCGATSLNTVTERGIEIADAVNGKLWKSLKESHPPQGTEVASVSHGLESQVAEAESRLWEQFDAVKELTHKLVASKRRQEGLETPPEKSDPRLDALRPPRMCAAVEGQAANLGVLSREGLLGPRERSEADVEWPLMRRAARASYVVAAFIPEISRGEGRQAVLEAQGTVPRMELLINALTMRRTVLTALLALADSDGDDAGEDRRDGQYDGQY